MAKRGETRPWRVRFRWEDTGIKGTDTYATEEQAKIAASLIRAGAGRMGRPVTVTVTHRDQDKP